MMAVYSIEVVMFRVTTLNINGIRAGARKGFFNWLVTHAPDVVCLQEVKASETQITDSLFAPAGYHRYWFAAEKKGYSGVAIYSRHIAENVQYGLGWELADTEGRYLRIDVGSISIASLYLPSGSSGELRQAAKFKFMEQFSTNLEAMQHEKRHHILCGDFNIVHQKIDIKNWAGNQKNSGCLPEERAWLDHLLTKQEWVDAFRIHNQEAEQYTWWSSRGSARAKNVGWRIDYHLVSPSLKDKITSAYIYKDEWFSDHAPVVIDYDITP